jgi:alkaline phosphatase D
MEPLDPDSPDPTERNRRQFLQQTGAVSVVATLGLSGEAAAIDEDGEFETDPFTLGVASGDPLPNSVILWTRLAPDPLAAGGGMPDQPIGVRWVVATDEAMDDVVTSGTATADPAAAHSVHVDADGLDPNTEYYYRFVAGGVQSPVGRTKTAPAPGSSPDEFRFAFASCQWWEQGYFTAYRHMATDELDLIVHLGDYIYEYGIPADGGARGRATPQAYRAEIETLDQYRLRYGLYKSDPDLRAAHASAPWLVTRDDHEVDNNWAGDVPENPGQQSTEAFLQRRAAAFQAYYEHMPFRMAQQPAGPDQKLYRNHTFGDLVEFNTLDTRLYRSDQACDDSFVAVDCEERFAEDRTILGDAQERWLLDNLETSEATWDVLANQLPMAQMDFKTGLFTGSAEGEGYRMDQWDGYVADQNAVLRAFEEFTRNPVVVTGDFHRNWACDLLSPDSGEPVGAEFVGTSISSGGDGTDMDAFGRAVIDENDNVAYYSGKRGYTRCTVTPNEWLTEFRVVESVTEPDAAVRTDARFALTDGDPGLQQPPTTLGLDPVTVRNGEAATTELFVRWLPRGFAGAATTLSVSDPEVASITGVAVADSIGISRTSVDEDGASATVDVLDVDDEVTSVAGGTDVALASITVEGDAPGDTDVAVSVERLYDDTRTRTETRAHPGEVVVEAAGR